MNFGIRTRVVPCNGASLAGFEGPGASQVTDHVRLRHDAHALQQFHAFARAGNETREACAVLLSGASSIDLSWRSHLRRFPLSRVYAADGLDTPEKSEGTSTKNCCTEPTCAASEATKVLQGVFECQRHQGSDGRLCD